MENIFHFNNVFFHDPLSYGEVLLYQIGRMHCNSTTVIATHFHNDIFELTIVRDGKGYVTSNNVTSTIQAGDIYLNLPYDTHKIVSDNQTPLKYDFIAFQTSNPKFRADLGKIEQLFKNPSWRIFSNETLNHLLNNCIYEFSKEKIYHEEALTYSLYLILTYVCRTFLQKGENVKKRISEKEQLCFQIMHYIDTHLYTIKSLKSIAEPFNYTYTYLSTVFKSTMKISLSEYYESKKFNLCKQLLTVENVKIFEVAELMGYSTPYAFSKAYKNYFLISPKKEQLNYRKTQHSSTIFLTPKDDK